MASNMKRSSWPRVILASGLYIGLFSVLPWQSAVGCSTVIGYVRPTNYELVKQATAIVVAQAVSFKRQKTFRGHHSGLFEFKVLEKLKGDCNATSLSVQGDDDFRSWGDPEDFSFNKGDHGPCNATDYKLNAQYVLFLENWKDKWVVSGPPFTRINVMVEGTNAPWVKAVRQYARVAALDNYEQEKDGLRDVRARALAKDPACPPGLVKDIDSHFLKPTPTKSFNDLKKLYQETEDLDTREYVLWAFVLGKKEDAKEFIRELMKGDDWKMYINPVCRYISEFQLTGFHEPLAAELAFTEKWFPRQMLLHGLVGTANASQQDFMQRVLESLNSEEVQEEAEILADWFITHPSPAAVKHYTALAQTNYAEAWKLTFKLAEMGDTNVIHWAHAFAKRKSNEAWMAYCVYARSPLPVADELARKVISKGDSDELTWLVQGYMDSKRTNRLDRLKEIVALKSKNRNLTYWLRRAFEDMVFDGYKEAEPVLAQLPILDPEPD